MNLMCMTLNNPAYFLFTGAAVGSTLSGDEFCTFFIFLASLTLLPVGSGRSLTDLSD